MDDEIGKLLKNEDNNSQIRPTESQKNWENQKEDWMVFVDHYWLIQEFMNLKKQLVALMPI